MDKEFWAIQIGQWGIKEFLRDKTYSPSQRNLSTIKSINPNDKAVFYFTGNNLENCPKKKVAYVAQIRKVILGEEKGNESTKVVFKNIRRVNGLSYESIEYLRGSYSFESKVGFGQMGFNIRRISGKDFRRLAKI